MRRRRVLRYAVLLVALLSLIPVSPVRAADIQPTITLDPVAPTLYRGAASTIWAHVSDGAPGSVLFQWSYDGTTWDIQRYGQGGPSSWSTQDTAESTTPLGTRYVRAHYPGSAGFLPAYSEPQTQDIQLNPSSITTFAIGSPPMYGTLAQILPGTPIRLSAAATSWVAFDRWIDGSWQQVSTPTTYVDLPALGEGTHLFLARIDENAYHQAATREASITITKGVTTPIWATELTVQANHPLPAQVRFDGPYGAVDMDGPMSVKDLTTNTVIASGTVGFEFVIPPMAAGYRDFEVTFLGSSNYEPSTKVFRVTVTPDGADATGVTRNYSTFYPVKDGYRDSVTMSGNRSEPSSVVIKVYSPGGSLVKAATLPRAIGKYSYAWNGRTTSGALRAAGKYKIVQILTDAGGASTVFTSYVNLSHKKLVTKTAYVTKLGSAVSAKGDPGTGSIVISTNGGYARLTGKYPNGWVGVGYQFTLPSATVYKSISFQVYSRGEQTAGLAKMGIQNFSTCPYVASGAWSEYCFDRWKYIGSQPVATTWFSSSANLTANRHGRTVRGMVSVGYSTQTIYKARIKVVYGVLQ